MNFSITCAAGLESILKKEIEIAGYKVLGSGPTRVRFQGELSAIAKMNLRSRVGNKIFIELEQHTASDFNQLFDLVQKIDWKLYVQGNPIIVNAITKQSLLTSTPTIQSITKKSIVKKLLDGKEGQLPEDHSKQTIEVLVYIERDMCWILLNTTGESLHKRGYKKATGEAPINESLAAGLLLLSGWKFSEPLYDFFCGSGTIAIEAALLAKNIAPGMFRRFAFENFPRYDEELLYLEIEAAKNKVIINKGHTIIASDIDPRMIAMAKENAKNAGVEEYITFIEKDISEYINDSELVGTMVSNPPYGLRMNAYDLEKLYHTITELFIKHPKLHGGIITSYEKFNPENGEGTRKKSVFFNGGERCLFYKKTLLK
ncbi:MAG: class I SAM-dependent RNA methyltransferase [candidate division SR1 bacterium]|nr:class I SAM-dependent RNA methyltransferase [candidate division SR1 bacterium]